MITIKKITAREILDSRSDPTIETEVILSDSSRGTSSIPSGVSTGAYEAHDLRDKDPSRYNGKGVLKAIENVNKTITAALIGSDSSNQIEIDKKLIELDKTENKENLGANAILSVSIAALKAAAVSQKTSLFSHINKVFGFGKIKRIPIPLFNLIEGGKHAVGNLDFQEFQIVPSESKTFKESLRMGSEVYQSLKRLLIETKNTYGLGDEGGYTPELFLNSEALDFLAQAIVKANYTFGHDAFLGLDVAATSFLKNGRYVIKDRTSPMDADDLVDYYIELNKKYPLFFLEDGFGEDDWSGWQRITKDLPKTIIVGDDLLVTNKHRIAEAIKKKACNAIIIKPNQIGTVSETAYVVMLAKDANWKIVFSHRGGETNDSFIADFAVGANADMVKFGAPARGERVAKYNRLLAIESLLKL